MGAPLFPQQIIARKRDGHELTRREIASFVRDATDGSWADYQLSAMLMAIFLRGMTPEETAHYTEAMMRSGVVGRFVEPRRSAGGQALDRRGGATRSRCTSRR